MLLNLFCLPVLLDYEMVSIIVLVANASEFPVIRTKENFTAVSILVLVANASELSRRV